MNRKILNFLVFIIVFTVFSSFSVFELTALSAHSAVIIEASTGTVVFEHNADEKLPEASTTKIMTALLALENCPYDVSFTVSEAAANVEGSQIGLLEGERIKLSDLLYMLMLRSGNDAAHVIAEGVAGSVDKFVEMMNKKAEELGCNSTHFSNPHGLPDDEHFTTAKDLAIISAEAYRNDDFRKIVSTDRAKLNYFGLIIENSNKLLDIYEYANGIKTGFTKAAGRCLVSSAEKDGVSLICVTLNAPDDWNDHISILNECFEKVEKTVLYNTGEYKTTVPSLGGTTPVQIINTQPIYGLNINGSDITFSLTENLPVNIFAPIDAGKTVGRLISSFNNKTVCSVPLAVSRTVILNTCELSFLERFLLNFSNLWL